MINRGQDLNLAIMMHRIVVLFSFPIIIIRIWNGKLLRND